MPPRGLIGIPTTTAPTHGVYGARWTISRPSLGRTCRGTRSASAPCAKRSYGGGRSGRRNRKHSLHYLRRLGAHAPHLAYPLLGLRGVGIGAGAGAQGPSGLAPCASRRATSGGEG